MDSPGRMNPRRALTSLVFALGSAAAIDAGQPGSGGRWDPVAALGIPRQEFGAARIGDSVFVVGGLNLGPGFPVALDTIEVYDLPTGTWSRAAEIEVIRFINRFGQDRFVGQFKHLSGGRIRAPVSECSLPGVIGMDHIQTDGFVFRAGHQF